MKASRIKVLLFLNVLLILYSAHTICSKMAGRYEFLSLGFCIFYALIILLLGIYAIGWQQAIKRLPLTTAYANKAVTVVWGMIFGAIVFKEEITIGKVLGGLLVITGVVLFAYADDDKGGDSNE